MKNHHESNHFATAIKELERKLELERERSVKLVEALKFYASGDQWNHLCDGSVIYRYNVINREDLGGGLYQLNETTDDERVGGLRARQALAEYEGE